MFHVQRIGLDTRYFEFVMEGGGGGDNTCEPQFGKKLSKVCEINVTRQQVRSVIIHIRLFKEDLQESISRMRKNGFTSM